MRTQTRIRGKIERGKLLRLLAPQSDLPLGPTYRCAACGTRVRTGQPHTAEAPYVHQTFYALVPRG